MKNLFVIIFAAACLLSCNAQSGQKGKEIVNLEKMTPEQKVSYSYGILLADNLKKGGMENLDADYIAQGIRDIMDGSEPRMTPTEAQMAFQAYAQEQQEVQKQKDLASAGVHLTEGQAFLENNKTKDGITTTASGLQYQIITEGTGPTPGPSDKVKTHYHGTLIDGTVFDSSVDRGEPISFGVGGVIKGWTEALQLMPVGSKWKLYIPTELAYGANPRPGVIKPNMALIFDIELLAIE